MYYVFYYLWRHNGAKIGDTAFILMLGTDLLVDWSLLNPMAEHKFLCTELLYRDYIPGPLEYLCISGVPSVWNCNFDILTHEDRLENEQLGNMDQYRATREIPLLYTFQDEGEDDNPASSGLKRPSQDAYGTSNSHLTSMRFRKTSLYQLFPSRTLRVQIGHMCWLTEACNWSSQAVP
ncbi:uncharacterized protein EI90DRAFT_3292457 [Cantharellus anzutake]|uniref:uncharacterized protein n=1 Tax=Cantharellus anzutake TaxID=1750568 RepID=UPI0019066EBC|nr:uncharacterized protein EI90DRAFT_3292457 [Cantharellus anzutake]KAF8322832.1 hypothetical protein EI90DRAFT_3292457 [Cantharellus anzutake]